MKKVDVSSVLNRIVSLHARSLPVYLTDAVPYLAAGSEAAQDSLKAIADDQVLMVNRIADHIQSLGGAVNPGSFPMHFAGWHDLTLDFLTAKSAERQANDIVEMESLIPVLASDPKAQSLAEEALGAAKAHLDTLADIAASAK
jgi:hypothetical protein